MRGRETASYRRTALPYGLWTCADGREILFNRRYTPIWQRHEGVVRPADPEEWIFWTTQGWFYNDGTPRRGLNRRLEAVLFAFHGGEDVTPLLLTSDTRSEVA